MKDKTENIAAERLRPADDPIERCVVCGAETPYRFSTPINQREFYIEGSGQLCRRCYYDIYGKKNG